jgi:HTH-type transcriptional regulator/antitoxin HipB
MSDFKKYIEKRKNQDPDFWKDFDERFETFKLGVLLKQARKEAEMTQEQIRQSSWPTD